MPLLQEQERSLFIPGPVGDLELLVSDIAATHATAIICHPHPLHGGTMQNKVVSTLARVCRDLGVRSVRFNFRGVGKSAGRYDEGRGELEDLAAVIHWVKETYPQDTFWLSGFSFGAAIAAKAATLFFPEKLITIAPPVPRFDLLDLPQVLCHWVVVQGDQDDVVEANAVYDWVEHFDPKPDVIRMADAGHFFHGKLLELRERLVGLLGND